MNCFLLIATHKNGQEYIESYLAKNKIARADATFYDEKITVDVVRDLKRSLVFKFKPGEKKTIVLNQEITIEAQNALLKCLEELSEQVELFIVSAPHEYILPTILSRCKIVSPAGLSDTYNKELLDVRKNIWAIVDTVTDLSKEPEIAIFIVMKNFRDFLLSDSNSIEEKRFAYNIIKKLQRLSPLVINNNVQLRIVLEKVFLSSLNEKNQII